MSENLSSFPRKMISKNYVDSRGHLNVLEFFELNKPIQRIFWISKVPRNETRANHGHFYGTQIIICMAESVEIMRVRSGGVSDILILNEGEMVKIEPGTWISITFMSNLTIVLILADSKYDESDVFNSFDEIE